MIDSDAQLGISEVLIERFEKDRLPRILRIKERVELGLALDDAELVFLQRIMSDAQENQMLVTSIPGCQDLFARVVHLYRDITAKALENEELR